MPSAGELTAWKNQTQARSGAERPPGPSPTRAAGPGWHARRLCRPPRAPWRPAPSSRRSLLQGGAGGDRHQHRGQAGQPQPDRVLGHARLVGPADRRHHAHARRRRPGPARPRRGRGGAPRCAGRPRGRATGPEASVVASRTGSPRLRAGRTTEPRAPSATRSARVGVSGQLHRDRHGLGRGLLDLSHHEAAGMGCRAPVDEAPGVAGHVGAGAPGQPRLDRGLLDPVARPVVGALRRAAAPRHNAAPRAARKGGEAGPASSTTATRTVPPTRRRARRRRGHHGAAGTSTTSSSAAPRRLRGPTNMSGPGGSTGPDAHTTPCVDTQRDGKAGHAVARRAAQADPGPCSRRGRARRCR